MVLVALAAGFRPAIHPLAWLAAAGLLLSFIAAVSWLAATVGLFTRSPEAANGFTFVAMFATYASSAFVPISTMPRWLSGFAEHQPCTPVIETIRALLLDGRIGDAGWQAFAWCAALLALSVAASGVLFRRRTL